MSERGKIRLVVAAITRKRTEAQGASRNEGGSGGARQLFGPQQLVHASSGMSGSGWATIRLACEVGWRRSAGDRSRPGEGYG